MNTLSILHKLLKNSLQPYMGKTFTRVTFHHPQTYQRKYTNTSFVFWLKIKTWWNWKKPQNIYFNWNSIQKLCKLNFFSFICFYMIYKSCKRNFYKNWETFNSPKGWMIHFIMEGILLLNDMKFSEFSLKIVNFLVCRKLQSIGIEYLDPSVSGN